MDFVPAEILQRVEPVLLYEPRRAAAEASEVPRVLEWLSALMETLSAKLRDQIHAYVEFFDQLALRSLPRLLASLYLATGHFPPRHFWGTSMDQENAPVTVCNERPSEDQRLILATTVSTAFEEQRVNRPHPAPNCLRGIPRALRHTGSRPQSGCSGKTKNFGDNPRFLCGCRGENLVGSLIIPVDTQVPQASRSAASSIDVIMTDADPKPAALAPSRWQIAPDVVLALF
jgi:hypothetical protein